MQNNLVDYFVDMCYYKCIFEKEGGEFCENKGFLQMWRGFIKFGNIKFIKPTKTNKKNV